MDDPSHIILGLDIGEKRIGVASSNTLTRLPQPLTTLIVDDQIIATITNLAHEKGSVALVAGLPRGLDGQETQQTKNVRSFIEKLQSNLGKIPVYLQDEAVTSVKAEEELKMRNKQHNKADIDSLAAVYILEDFLREHQEEFTV